MRKVGSTFNTVTREGEKAKGWRFLRSGGEEEGKMEPPRKAAGGKIACPTVDESKIGTQIGILGMGSPFD